MLKIRTITLKRTMVNTEPFEVEIIEEYYINGVKCTVGNVIKSSYNKQKMDELKTLKDFDSCVYTDGSENKFNACVVGIYHGTDPRPIVGVEELKQEAIKWIKYLLENSSQRYSTPRIEWIKHFFNITDEDLKSSYNND